MGAPRRRQAMPSSQGAVPAGGSATVPGAQAPEHVPQAQEHVPPAQEHVPPAQEPGPQLILGVELPGEYQGSGLTEATYLARKPGGQVVQVSRLLHLVLSGIDGRRTVSQVAGHASAAFGRTVSAGNVDYLLASKLAPLGLVPAEHGQHGQHGAERPAQDQPVLTLKLRRTMVPAARG